MVRYPFTVPLTLTSFPIYNMTFRVEREGSSTDRLTVTPHVMMM